MTTSYTNATALRKAIEILGNMEGNDAALIEKLSRMADVAEKPRKKSDVPTKAQIENERLMRETVKAIVASGNPQSSKWIMEHVNFMTSTQKVTAIMQKAVKAGLIEIIRTPNKPIAYRAI